MEVIHRSRELMACGDSCKPCLERLHVVLSRWGLRDQLAEDATSRYRRSSRPKHPEMAEELLAGV